MAKAVDVRKHENLWPFLSSTTVSVIYFFIVYFTMALRWLIAKMNTVIW